MLVLVANLLRGRQFITVRFRKSWSTKCQSKNDNLVAAAAVIPTSSPRDEIFDQSEVRTGLLGFYCGGKQGVGVCISGVGICYGEFVHNK